MKQIVMEKAVLNPMKDPSKWVGGWAGIMYSTKKLVENSSKIAPNCS